MDVSSGRIRRPPRFPSYLGKGLAMSLKMAFAIILRGCEWTLTSRDGLRHDAQVRPRRLPALRVGLLGVVIADRAGDDDVLALLPVGWSRHLVLRGQLQGIDDAQHLVEISSRGHRIDQDQLDLLVRPNDEDVAHGL